MAVALGLDYWLLPQINSTYQGNYTVNQENIQFFSKLLVHVINDQSLQSLLKRHEDRSQTDVALGIQMNLIALV
jgi:hypothetical protein